jgi:hypothetical protein
MEKRADEQILFIGVVKPAYAVRFARGCYFN